MEEQDQTLRFGHLNATVRSGETGRLWLTCDQCFGPVTLIEAGMSLDDLLMAYGIHQHDQ